MKRLDVRFTRAPGDEFSVGVLAEDAGRVCFEYDAAFLRRGLERTHRRRLRPGKPGRPRKEAPGEPEKR